jgi:hypothetical protein
MAKRIEPIVEGYGKMEENNTFNGDSGHVE